MGKKCKRKVQWRRLSLNELQSKTSDEECDDEEDKDKQSSCTPPPPPPSDSRPQNRRPFHPNFHSGDQRRYSPHFDQRGPPFERDPSLERNPYPKYFGRPYHHHHHQDNRPQFPGQRRRPFKFYGRGGFYVRGPCSYSGDRGPRRRWSEDDGVAFKDENGRVGADDDVEDEERPSQPVHTVFIGNEEYTKIQTPRQEVIFKKSSLDKKRDSVDLGSASSISGSVNGYDPSCQGDQASSTGSIEDTVMSPGEDSSHDNMKENGPYEDTNNMFVEEPGNPPLVGVVMQQAYPGGPMISIPVHWTPFLDPGLIPGDTALTPLNPAFTHVIDPKDLLVDPAHILPVQHDSNGCPVTVQVKVNADGLPVEIEPSAFTVSLSTLEPRQQEILLRKSSDLLSGTQIQASETATRLPAERLTTTTAKKLTPTEVESEVSKVSGEVSKESEEKEESQRGVHEHGEEFSSDSQYATMSETSTTPTTPSGELCDLSETADPSKRNPEDKDKQMSRSDSLLDSEPDENEVSPSYHPLNSLDIKGETCPYETESLPAQENNSYPLTEESSVLGSVPDVTNLTLPTSSNLPSSISCKEEKLSISDVTGQSRLALGDTIEGSGAKKSRKKKNRSISIDSTVSSQNSLADIQQNNSKDTDGEILSKYQIKKNAKKLKKEKRSSREKIKSKNNSAKDAKKSEIESENINKEDLPEKSDQTSDNSDILEKVEARLDSLESSSPVHVEKEEENVCAKEDNETQKENESINNEEIESINNKENELINNEGDTRQVNGNDKTSVEDMIQNQDKNSELNANEENSKTSNEKEIKEETENKNASPSSEREDGSFTCKQGYVMVPILTPYYDPAVLYGYPVIIPENPPERNYGRKKKKKFKRRHHEEIYLDTELYAGEPFVATPNGYVVPVDTSQICQIHGYQYLPNVFPHILPDEGFVSVEHSPYLPEYYPEPVYHKLHTHEEIEKANRRVPKLYEEEEERKPVEVGGGGGGDVQRENKRLKDHNESCDSGVSESEEMVLLTKGTKDVPGGGNGKNEDTSKNTKDDGASSKSEKENDDKQEENPKGKEGKKEGKKKKKHSKKKREVVEILEPDFASFDTPTPRFEVSKDDEQSKTKIGKKTRNKKKQNNNQLEHKNSESISPKNVGKVTKNVESKVMDDDCSESGKASPQLENKTKKDSKNKESKKQNKTKNKSPKTDKRRTKSLVEDKNEIKTRAVDISSAAAAECLIKNNFIEEVCEREDFSCEVEDMIAVKNDESEGECITNIHSAIVQEVLSQESGIGAESEESMTFSENYESITMQEDKDQTELDLDHETLVQLDSVVQTEQETNEKLSNINLASCPVIQTEQEVNEELSNVNIQSSPEAFPEDLILHSNNKNDCTTIISESSYEKSLLDEKIDITIEESVPSEKEDPLLVQTISPLTLVQSEAISSDSLLVISSHLTSNEIVEEVPLTKEAETSSSTLLEENQCSSFKVLGVTEAVRRWIREVTPEKAFSITDETTRHILFANAVAGGDEICEESDEELDITESKNVLGNPFVVSPSKTSLDASGERVASRASFPSQASQDAAAASRRLRRHTTSQDSFEDFDGESVLNNLGWSSMHSSTSSSSSFPFLPSSEDSTLLTDPRIYDPSVYSQYYQLSADVQVTSSTPSTRESTLSPSLVESVDCDLFTEDGSPSSPTDHHVLSIAAELLKSEKIRANMAHISPSFCDNTLPMPLCGSSAPYLLQQLDHNRLLDEGERKIPDLCCSVSSSGIGSSLASTPNLTPAHQFSSSNSECTSKPKLEPHPLVNLSVGEGPLPCRTMCCSVMDHLPFGDFCGPVEVSLVYY